MSDDDLSVIQSDFIKKKVKQFFVEKLNSNNLKITMKSGSKNGDNFVGIIYRITGEIINGIQKNTKKLKIILKIAPSNPLRREKFLTRIAFLLEMYTYNEVRENNTSFLILKLCWKF